MTNVLFMHTHDTGRYIEPYGHRVPTPELLKLAKESFLFRHAYSAAPTCSPSRAALLSGMAPHSCGMLGLAHMGFSMQDHNQHLASYLSSHGYESVLFGVQHETTPEHAEQLGYSFVSQGGGDEENARKAAAFVKQHQAGDGSRPFFLSFGMNSTHREFPPLENDINPDYVIPPFPLYDNRLNRLNMAHYISSAKRMDRCMGIVMEAMRESGLERDTIIIFTTDHGIPFPHAKGTLSDLGIGVALLIKVPGMEADGGAEDALVSQLDLFPTICDVLQIPKPDWLQGTSLMPLLGKASERVRTEIFAESNFHTSYDPMRCVRTERYKLIRLYRDASSMVPSHIDDCASKYFLIEHGWLRHTQAKEMLFDLYLDPMESRNLVGNAHYSEPYLKLSRTLDQWMQHTADPLLEGELKHPAGVQLHASHCLSHRLCKACVPPLCHL